MTTKLMAGIDLHSNNLFCAIVDMEGRRVFEKRLPCEMESVAVALKPFKKRLEKIAVESTYNWYWLVDGLQDRGHHVVLANPAAMKQYEGLKHGDDKSDAFFLAEMLRLGILPTGHICDRKLRPVRDLLRRRMSLVHKRTSVLLSFKSLCTRMPWPLLGLHTPNLAAELIHEAAAALSLAAIAMSWWQFHSGGRSLRVSKPSKIERPDSASTF